MKTAIPFGAVERNLVGDNNPSVKPGHAADIFGRATLEPTTPVEVRSFQTFTLTYTVGKLGLDDTGGIRIAWRVISDAGRPQLQNPNAANYVTAASNGEGRLDLKYDIYGGQRPWNEVLTIIQRGGYLRPGEKITVTLGDTSQGSPGMLMQTFVEGGREFRVMADVQATGNFVELPDNQLAIPIVPGPAVNWHAVLPSLRRPKETFHLGIKVEDKWGNPTSQVADSLKLVANRPVNNLPENLLYQPEDRALCLENLSVESEGALYIRVYKGDEQVAQAGPLIIREGKFAGFWGDMHGQTGETVGTNTLENYLDFARNKAFLDTTSHQANDFQITPAFWDKLNRLTAEADEPGRFTVFPGYEWSGNTAVGGDHNVLFRHENCTIRRCSHALIEGSDEMDTDAHTLTDLFAAFNESGEDVVIYAHVGGRYADIHYDHDALLETAVEMHSAWGSFEWVLKDGFELGRRVGVVCNSDGHKGRPGASYPGASIFGAYGGLTCFIAPENTRAALFEAMRRRHHYGTTGCRMHMDITVQLPEPGTLYERNPDAMPDTKTFSVTEAIMGDIVQTNAKAVMLKIEVAAHSGIERIEIRNGSTLLETCRPYESADLGKRVRVLWSGAEYRGRGRNTQWRGRAQFNGTTISAFQTFNRWNPEMLFEQRGSDMVVWDTITTGNFMGFDVVLADLSGEVVINTNHGDIAVDTDNIGYEDTVLDAGGLGRQLKLYRLPNQALPNHMIIEREIRLNARGDTPLWISVITEDGYQAWSSPVYLFHPK